MKAFFLNNSVEAELLESKYEIGIDDIVVPVGPDARYYAEQRGWNIRLIGSFFSDESHRVGREASQNIVRDVAKGINKLYGQDDSFPKVPLGDYYLFDLHILIGQILFAKQLIEEIPKEYSILVFENEDIVDTSVWGIRPHPDSLLASVALGLMGENIEVISYSIKKAREKATLSKRMRNLMSAATVDVVYKLLWLRELYKKPSLWFKKRKKVIVLGGMFDWKPVVFSSAFIEEYSATFKSLSSYANCNHDESATARLCKVISEIAFPGQSNIYDFQKFAQQIHSTAIGLNKNCRSFAKLVGKHDAVLVSVFVAPLQHALANCAASIDKPIICYQHGEMNLYPDVFSEFTELMSSTHYFAYGEGVVSKYNAFIGKKKLKEVTVVGSTRKIVTYNAGNTVVYATGKWFKAARPYMDAIDPDARLYEAQREIISYLNEYAKRNPGDRVVVKANNTDLFNQIPFPDSADIKIDYISRFTDLLKNARMVILDAPATTCIEAASTSVPLFVLSGRSAWYEQPMEMLKKRAVVEGQVGALIEQIAQYEKTGVFLSDVNSRELANEYAGTCDTGMAIEKTMQNLTRIIEE